MRVVVAEEFGWCRYPLLILIYITTFLGATGEEVAIPFLNIVISLVLIVIPASIGMLAASKFPAAAKHIETGGSVLGGIFLVMSATAPHRCHQRGMEREQPVPSVLTDLKLQTHSL